LIRRIRLVSGLILFSYLVAHFSNHALGLVSLEAMDDTLYWLFRFWTSWPAAIALYGALLVHFCLALYALWERQTLRLRPREAVQYSLGFLVPVLLAAHVVSIRIGQVFFQGDLGHYRSRLMFFFYNDEWAGVLQGVALAVAWIHAWIGLRFWLRLKPWYEAAQPYLFAFALLLPVLALLGYVVAGRHVAMLAQDPAWVAETLRLYRPPSPEGLAALKEIILALRGFVLAAIVAALLARIARRRWQKRHGVARITYPDGRFIDVARGVSVLEASRLLGVPHAAVCGGRGRCSTWFCAASRPVPACASPASCSRQAISG
jgi:adenylate cyclase